MLFFAFPHYLNWSACSFTNKTKRDNSIWLFIFDAVSTAKTSCGVTNIEPSFSLDWNKSKPVIITQNNEFKYIYIYFMTRNVKPKQFSPRLICFVDKPNRTKDSLKVWLIHNLHKRSASGLASYQKGRHLDMSSWDGTILSGKCLQIEL